MVGGNPIGRGQQVGGVFIHTQQDHRFVPQGVIFLRVDEATLGRIGSSDGSARE